jgi:hypothetical protein
MKLLLLPLLLFPIVVPAFASEGVKELEYRLAAATSMADERQLGLAMVDLVGSACSGNAGAAAALGSRYMTGAGEFEQAPGKALTLLRFASQRGIARAMPDLVLLLSRADSSPAEIEEAAKWRKIGNALSPGSMEMAIAAQAFEIARNGRDATAGYQAAAVWLQKRNLGMSTENASIDCSAW